ncbi:ATP-binding protein [Arenimonas sp.]|uniref:ATP-binding protein n=1 Tax=Arenimonas sp. TaxID=1872635 RepID=UPI0025B84762|nr:ATP-binding protein [Arenimonas sp.]
MSPNHRLLESINWSGTPLGDRSEWPASMHQVIDVAMHSGFPVCTIWGEDGIQIYNDAYNDIFGHKHPGAFGAPVRESWTEIWPFLEPAIEQIRRTQQPMNFKDFRLLLAKHEQPREYYFDFSYSAVRAGDGSTLGLMSIASETTQAHLYRRRQDSCSLPADAMDRLGIEGVASSLRERLSANTMDAQAAVLLHVDPASGRPDRIDWALHATPEQAQGLMKTVAPLGATEVQALDLGGQPWAASDWSDQAAAVPLCEANGRPLAVLVIVPNVAVEADGHLGFARSLGDRLRGIITPARALDRVKRQMAEQEDLYRFLFENIADPAIYAKTDGHVDSEEVVLAANPAACRLLGFDDGKLVGVRRDDLLDPSDPTLLDALQVRERDGIFFGELCFRRKDGTSVPVEISSRLVQTETGELRSVNLLRDISSRLTLEAERARRSRHETIARLTGGFAHDFNNLLAVITGNLDLARESLAQESPIHRKLQTAQLCAERGAALTSQLLSYARLQPLHLRPLDMNSQLQAIRDLLTATAGGQNQVSFSTRPDLPACRGDEAQLTTAVINLVANARDAMPSGGRIELSTDLVTVSGQDALPTRDAALAPGRYVRLTVRDQGPGIDPAIRERIFEPYVSSKDPGKRSGLGLAMVQGLARQCGGDVLASDAEGGGARFDLLLPALAEAAAETRAGHDAAAASPSTPARILLVEDHADVRDVLREMLAGAGHAVQTAESGRAAIKHLHAAGDFDLLITDLVMPGGVSGMVLAEEAKRIDPGIGVLVITGHDPWGVTRAGEKPAFELLTKPITRHRLIEAVERVRSAGS